MDRRFAKELLGLGRCPLVDRYILGIVLIGVVPTSLVGWVILPIGVAITCWVLVNQVRSEGLARYTLLGVVWTLIAIVFDYVFIVAAFHPADGYYKPDVYVYYALTFVLPVLVGRRENDTMSVPRTAAYRCHEHGGLADHACSHSGASALPRAPRAPRRSSNRRFASWPRAVGRQRSRPRCRRPRDTRARDQGV